MAVWYCAAYRLPIASVGAERRLDPRRADFVAWYLLERAGVSPSWFREPVQVSYAALARVHDSALLESLTTSAGLARVFAVSPAEVPVSETLRSVRLACGATVEAAREALSTGLPTCNLLGGFHHATPDRAAAFCPVNDIAVAVAELRAQGVTGQVVVIDLDAHPPDGTAACLADDEAAWIGSLSGVCWQTLPGVDETVLPRGCGDAAYLAALGALLERMPRPELAFVIAGGDVLRGDCLGMLGMSLAGARERDLRVAEALEGVPSVWLPGGGYHSDAWRVCAGTALAVGQGTRRAIPLDYDPLDAHFSAIAERLGGESRGGGDEFELAEIEAELFGRGLPAQRMRLFDTWNPAGIEYALYRFGILPHLRRLGYGDFRVTLSQASAGQCVRLHAAITTPALGSRGPRLRSEHVLAECVLARQRVDGHELLFINWLTLRNPRAAAAPEGDLLPGQEAPGLGLMRETEEIFEMMAERLELAGTALCPAHYHLAVSASRRGYRFADGARHGRFEALMRDLEPLGVRAASSAVYEGRVRLEGAPYTWEPSVMVAGIPAPPDQQQDAVAERERVSFSCAPAAG